MSLLHTQTIQSNDLVSTSTPVLPAIDITHSELVLHDDDGNSRSCPRLEELSGYDRSSANICPAAINVESSTDIMIGPVTQFHGNVTIYHNVNESQPIHNTTNHSNNNGKLAESRYTSTELSQTANNPPFRKAFIKSNYVKAIFLVTFIFIAGFVGVILWNIHQHSWPQEPDQSILSTSSSLPPESLEPIPSTSSSLSPDSQNSSSRPSGTIIGRDQWGAKPPKYKNPLVHPTSLVIISHTATNYCDTLKMCSTQVSRIQSNHMSRGTPDIGYNFLVGGDGNVFARIGWDLVNFYRNYRNSIGISFIGNYVYNSLTPDMIQSVLHLLEEGVNKGKLAQNYTLVAHNQTYATKSPGPNVYEVIKLWPHFSSKLMR